MYHDKPKIGTFMMRIKIPGGILTPAGLRTIGEISGILAATGELTGRTSSSITSRSTASRRFRAAKTRA
jgi:ferredoxin-nitrite reductase